MVAHLDNEEQNAGKMYTKYLTLLRVKKVVRDIWDLHTCEEWRRIIPFVLNNDYYHGRRVQFLQSLRVSVPERIVQIGLYAYEGCRPEVFQLLRTDFPDFIPRHVQGWESLH